VRLSGFLLIGNSVILSFKGIEVAVPLKMHVPTGSVGMDSSVILSI